MKSLVLMRHAKSSWKSDAPTDFERPLNKRGRRAAPLIGRRLARHKVHPDLIFSSPANRAITTAMIVAEELKVPPKRIRAEMEIYNAPATELLQIIQSLPDSAGSVLLVGHNPGFGEMAQTLANQEVENLPTAGMICLDFPIDSWKLVQQGTGSVRFFEYPKKLKWAKSE